MLDLTEKIDTAIAEAVKGCAPVATHGHRSAGRPATLGMIILTCSWPERCQPPVEDRPAAHYEWRAACHDGTGHRTTALAALGLFSTPFQAQGPHVPHPVTVRNAHQHRQAVRKRLVLARS